MFHIIKLIYVSEMTSKLKVAFLGVYYLGEKPTKPTLYITEVEQDMFNEPSLYRPKSFLIQSGVA